MRKFKATLRVTVQRAFDEIIAENGLIEDITYHKTERTYVCGKRMVEFMGADDKQKLRGAKRAILYCNEANELNFKQEFYQLLMRTRNKVLLDFNPDDEDVRINHPLAPRLSNIPKPMQALAHAFSHVPTIRVGCADKFKRNFHDSKRLTGLQTKRSHEPQVRNSFFVG